MLAYSSSTVLLMIQFTVFFCVNCLKGAIDRLASFLVALAVEILMTIVQHVWHVISTSHSEAIFCRGARAIAAYLI